MADLVSTIKALLRRVSKLEAIVVRSGTAGMPLYASVTVTAVSYTLLESDFFVVFTAGGKTATLPAAPPIGQTYRIANEAAAGNVTIDGDGTDTIKGSLTQFLAPGEDLILTYYATGKWA